MALHNEIVLRPRFQMELDESNETLLQRFEAAKSSQTDFIVTRIDDHVFIKIPQERRHYWSPQLHLEIMETENGQSKLFGLFGPNPTVWTMFMFLHFIVAGLFVAFGIWAYSNWSLNGDYAVQLFVCLMMVVIWFALYFGGRVGKATGKDQMHELHAFMTQVLNS